MPRFGIIITGFGGPDCPEAVGPFMRNLTGREPAPEIVARVAARYRAIGGCSPLTATARMLASKVERALAARGIDAVAEVGMRYWEPYIADAVARLAGRGVTTLVAVALSPFETHVTHGEYRAALDAALQEFPHITALEAPLLSSLPAYVRLHAEAARRALEAVPAPAPVVFSAHSLPLRDVSDDDAYVSGLTACAEAIGARLGLAIGAAAAEPVPGIVAHGTEDGERPWLVAFQSKGMRGGEWLGPDVDEVTDAIAAVGGEGVVVVPIGFATEHMETLYDLDVVSAGHATTAGIAFARSSAPDAADALVEDLADTLEALLA